ncbi:MAG: glucokinase [Pseudomonadota bacterium]
MMPNTAIIADIGGTNARFALVDHQGCHDVLYLECKQFPDPVAAAEAYLKEVGAFTHPKRPTVGLFAVAGPVMSDWVHFTNLSWNFSISEVGQTLKLAHFDVINDFKAVALAIPGIKPELAHRIGGNAPLEHYPKGIIGPGTGLGVAALFWGETRYLANACEGSHVTMPFINAREFAIYEQLRSKYNHISAERVCSGIGLEDLYHTIRMIDGKEQTTPTLSAQQISEKALNNSCLLCKEALDLFLAFLGRIAGNLALTLNAWGGTYIAGGIPTKLGNYFLTSQFLSEFQTKGRMSEHVKQMPVFLIQHEALGMLGLEQEVQYLLK